jgi:aminoglycoside phosphotransferase (APT) family kinase protein
MTTDASLIGIDIERVSEWFRSNVPQAEAPLTFELIAGGNSNLTYRVGDGTERRWVLRRPPVGHVLATAHDMSREFRIISALRGTDVPVAPAVGLCTDDEVIRAPFYVMEYVDGYVLFDESMACGVLNEDARRSAGRQAVEILARIHAVDADACGLGTLGRREGYIERQLNRWSKQLEQSKSRDLPQLDSVHRRLAAKVPIQGPSAIVHGDFRLDNCIVDSHGQIRAVLDWELATLGDPLADLGMLLLYWQEPGEPDHFAFPNVTKASGFLRRTEVLDLYTQLSGRDTSEASYYCAFACWRLACIGEGIYARYRSGAMGRPPADVSLYAKNVEYLAERADQLLGEGR